MEVHLNTLYVMTHGSYVRRERQNIVVEVEKTVRSAIPIHHLDGIAIFGRGMVSPSAMAFCQESGVSLTFLTESGRLMARVDAPRSGNVLLRRRAVPARGPAGRLREARPIICRRQAAQCREIHCSERLEKKPARLIAVAFEQAASLISGHIEELACVPPPRTASVATRATPRGCTSRRCHV